MQYLLMIYSDENTMKNMNPDEMGAYLGAYQTFSKDVAASGNMLGGNALQGSETATCVSLNAGKIVTTDGPFIETKEQLGGYYLIEAKDLDEAVEIASRIPTAKHGTIEVRPIMVFG